MGDGDPIAQYQSLYSGGLILIMVGALALLALQIASCRSLVRSMDALPAQYRQQSPRNIWLLLLPLFSQGYCFFVYPRIARSFQAYFRDAGRTNVGDCGLKLAQTTSMLWASCVVPIIGYFTIFLAFGATWVFVLKIRALKALVGQDIVPAYAVAAYPVTQRSRSDNPHFPPTQD
jgi:hypothetical protein